MLTRTENNLMINTRMALLPVFSGEHFAVGMADSGEGRRPCIVGRKCCALVFKVVRTSYLLNQTENCFLHLYNLPTLQIKITNH